MAPDAGMLFKYREPRSASHGFWMYKTLIPLDIAYLNEDGKIGSIRKMVPCPSASGSGCPTYPAGVPFIEAGRPACHRKGQLPGKLGRAMSQQPVQLSCHSGLRFSRNAQIPSWASFAIMLSAITFEVYS